MTHTPLPPFAGWSGPRDARIVFVGEAWGQSEAELRKPLVGESGKEWFRMVGEAWPHVAPELHEKALQDQQYGLAWIKSRETWLNAASVGLTNVFAFRPTNNKLETICSKKAELPKDYNTPPLSAGGYLRPEYFGEIERLKEELRVCSPNLVIMLGNTACWALLGRAGIAGIRGTVTSIKV